MDFSEALFLMKAGKRVRRDSWDSVWVGMDYDAEKKKFSIIMNDGQHTQPVYINTEMVTSEDWQEVEKD